MLMFVVVGGTNVEAATDQLIIINKSTNKLAFFENGKLVKTFSVGTGRTNDLTPEGRFPIVNKIKNRPYYKEGIPGGDPRNPLGNRWLGLNALGTYGTTYAIHGNNNANSIGKYVSAGCVRMHNNEISWLFDRVKLHTDVIILRSAKTFEQIAADHGYKTTPPIKIMIDGKEMNVSNPPFMQNNRVLVPMRSVFNALGATVVWDEKTKTITAAKDGKKMTLTINSKKATLNGKSYMLDVAPMIYNGQTFVPTRFVSEALGAQVKWNGAKRVVSLTSPPKQAPKPAEPVKQPIQVIVNGSPVASDAFVLEGIAFVPARDMFNWLTIPFSYDTVTRTLEAKKNGLSLKAKVDSKVAHMNGAQVNLPAAPMIYNGKLYVPVRAITEAFNGAIQWENKKLHITIK